MVYRGTRNSFTGHAHQLNDVSKFSRGLVGFWPLGLYPDGRDLSLFGNNGSLEGGLSTADLVGNGNRRALQLDGSADYVDLAGPPEVITDLVYYSVSAWVRQTSSTTREPLLGFSASNFYPGFWLRYNSLPLVFLGGGNYRYFNNTALEDNAWHHVLWTVDESYGNSTCRYGVEGYVDGVVMAKSTYGASSPVDTKTVLQIGQSASENCHAELDDVRIYSRIFTANEAAQLYTDTLPGGYGDLLIPARRAATWFVGGAGGDIIQFPVVAINL